MASEGVCRQNRILGESGAVNIGRPRLKSTWLAVGLLPRARGFRTGSGVHK